MIVTLGTVTSSLTSAFFIEKIGTSKIVYISCLMTGTALLGISFLPSFYWMIPLVLPLGLGAGAVDAALNNYVALHFRAHHMNWLHSFWGIGATLGPLIMGTMIMNRDWQSGYRIIGFIQLGLSLLILGSLPLWSRHKPEITRQTPHTSGSAAKDPAFRIPGVKSALVSCNTLIFV